MYCSDLNIAAGSEEGCRGRETGASGTARTLGAAGTLERGCGREKNGEQFYI